MRVATDLSFVGNPEDLRVKASSAAKHGEDCPGYLWKEVRPSLFPDSAGWRSAREPWPFMQGVIVDAIRQIALGSDPETVLATAVQKKQRGVPLHPGVQEYVRHAVSTYQETDESRQSLIGATLDYRDQRTIKVGNRGMQGWGLWLEDSSGSVREVRRLRNRSARGTERPDQIWAAVMAKLAVDGRAETTVGEEEEPDLVVVVEIGLGDGSDREVFRGTAPEARRFWDDVGRPAVTEMIGADELRPSRSCTSCAWLTSCPAVPASGGALGLDRPAAYRRSVSAADLDRYARCPAQYAMERLFFLPTQQDEPSEAQIRGIRAHEWLAAAHSRAESARCTSADLPTSGTDPLDVLAEHEISLVAPYLAGHIDECPLDQAGIHSIQVEAPQRLYDPDADVLMVAKPDMVIFRDGVETWRETKTTGNQFPPSLEDLLMTYTSAAFNMVLLAELSTLRSGAPSGVIEFEILRPLEAAVYPLAVGDERLLALARTRLAELTHEWSVDITLAANPGAGCHWCSVQRWCPSAEQGLNASAPSVEEPIHSRDIDDIPF